jgi:hypothetical protein
MLSLGRSVLLRARSAAVRAAALAPAPPPWPIRLKRTARPDPASIVSSSVPSRSPSSATAPPHFHPRTQETFSHPRLSCIAWWGLSILELADAAAAQHRNGENVSLLVPSAEFVASEAEVAFGPTNCSLL